MCKCYCVVRKLLHYQVFQCFCVYYSNNGLKNNADNFVNTLGCLTVKQHRQSESPKYDIIMILEAKYEVTAILNYLRIAEHCDKTVIILQFMMAFYGCKLCSRRNPLSLCVWRRFGEECGSGFTLLHETSCNLKRAGSGRAEAHTHDRCFW